MPFAGMRATTALLCSSAAFSFVQVVAMGDLARDDDTCSTSTFDEHAQKVATGMLQTTLRRGSQRIVSGDGDDGAEGAADSARDGDNTGDSSSDGADDGVGKEFTKVNQGRDTEGRVFFLFLTGEGVIHEELWQDFFVGADPRHYKSFLHCHKRCNHSKVVDVAIKTVKSKYCADLVSPMVALLMAATAESASPRDKFVFLSDATLAIKPFPQVYESLMADASSDICIALPSSWPWVRLGNSSKSEHGYLVKHSQWVVLNRDHAQALVQAWPSVHGGRCAHPCAWSSLGAGAGVSLVAEAHPRAGSALLKVDYLMRDAVTENPPRKLWRPGDSLVELCLDEWAIFASLFGALPDDGRGFVEGLQRLAPNGRLETNMTSLQGVCRTFVPWNSIDRIGADLENLVHALKEDQDSHFSNFPSTSSHPGEFLAVSNRSLEALRRSDYLFARKFHRDAVSRKQYRHFVLDDPTSAI